MKYLIDLGNRYMKQSNWRDLALIKLCLFSIGILVCSLLSGSAKEIAVWIAIVVFIFTYIPLMVKFFWIMKKGK